MYKVTAFIFFIVMAFACNSETMNGNNSLPEGLEGEWVLESIEPANPVMEDVNFDDMDFRETYTFNSDGTFRKVRNDGQEASGTVSTREADNTTYYILNYEEGASVDLINSCQNGEESLKMEGNLLVNDSRMCDRPRYAYGHAQTEK